MSQPGELLGRVLYRFADPHWVVEVQRDYVRFFREATAGKVLDLGSGRGLFLDVLREAGIDAAGIDSNADAVRASRDKGFADVEVGDVLEYLDRKAREDARFAGILCSHLIEHLHGDRAARLIELCASVLEPGGRIVLVTPNVANLYVWQSLFWMDPTHVRPYPRAIVETLLTEAGLAVVASYDDARTRPRYSGRKLLTLPKDLLRYGWSLRTGVDSVVVAEKPR